MSRIGIMGGTFNPIHTGHLLLAEHVLEMVGLDQVWLIPTGCSYLKRKEGITVLSAEDRYRMVNLAIADNDRFRCLDMEIRRPGNSYSYETMEQLPDLAPLVDYLETSQPFAYPTQSKKFADRLISLMQEALMNEESTLTGQEIVTQLAEEFGNK